MGREVVCELRNKRKRPPSTNAHIKSGSMKLVAFALPLILMAKLADAFWIDAHERFLDTSAISKVLYN
jgi:hypothetical protein